MHFFTALYLCFSKPYDALADPCSAPPSPTCSMLSIATAWLHNASAPPIASALCLCLFNSIPCYALRFYASAFPVCTSQRRRFSLQLKSPPPLVYALPTLFFSLPSLIYAVPLRSVTLPFPSMPMHIRSTLFQCQAMRFRSSSDQCYASAVHNLAITKQYLSLPPQRESSRIYAAAVPGPAIPSQIAACLCHCFTSHPSSLPFL